MSAFYLNQASSVYIVGRADEVPAQVHTPPFILDNVTTSLSCPTLFGNCHRDRKVDDHHHQAQLQQMPREQWLMTGSPHVGDSSNTLKLSLGDHYDQTPSQPNKWMSSKMRFMRKMMNSDDHVVLSKPRRRMQESQDQRQGKQASNNNNMSDFVRVCSDCNTTKTPLWRSGPRGPKSLCNACGIRQRKARRAMAAAGVTVNGGINPSSTQAPVKVRKERSLVVDCNLPIKKRCKIATATYTPCFDDGTTPLSLSVNSTFHKVFPQDERDAAILLMTLSYGFIRS